MLPTKFVVFQRSIRTIARCGCDDFTKVQQKRLRFLVTKTTKDENNKVVVIAQSNNRSNSYNKRRTIILVAATTTVSAIIIGYSYIMRRKRFEWIENDIHITKITTTTDLQECYPYRSITDIISVIQRAGLMGKHRSVKSELDDIRDWHNKNGYKGGLVVRDVTIPLFWEEKSDNNNNDNTAAATKSGGPSSTWTLEDILSDPLRLARRECYYIYYEISSHGKHTQQIFCRGTTLAIDILTCIQAWRVYDNDCECYIHKGFCNTANRILEDIIPLLARDPRCEIELCGHSLGGAVATILAIKLYKRGYNIVRLTTIGEPAFILCTNNHHLEDILPKDHIRIEDEYDFVPFLPPFFGKHIGNKIWLLSDGTIRFVPSSIKWTDSFFINFCLLLPNVLLSNGKPHRIPNYVNKLNTILNKSKE